MSKTSLKQILENLRAVHSALSAYQMTDDEAANSCEDYLVLATSDIESAIENVESIFGELA